MCPDWMLPAECLYQIFQPEKNIRKFPNQKLLQQKMHRISVQIFVVNLNSNLKQWDQLYYTPVFFVRCFNHQALILH